MKTIKKVEIENAKSFEGKTVITFSPKLNVVTGLNGAGKSNLLEAIYFGLGKELEKDFISKGKDFAEVKIHLSNGEEISQKITKEDYANSKNIDFSGYDDLNFKVIDNFGDVLNEKNFKEYADYIKECSNEIQIIAVSMNDYFIKLADKVITVTYTDKSTITKDNKFEQ